MNSNQIDLQQIIYYSLQSGTFSKSLKVAAIKPLWLVGSGCDHWKLWIRSSGYDMSVLGYLLFSLYMLPVGEILQNTNIDYRSYADGTQTVVVFGTGKQGSCPGRSFFMTHGGRHEHSDKNHLNGSLLSIIGLWKCPFCIQNLYERAQGMVVDSSALDLPKGSTMSSDHEPGPLLNPQWYDIIKSNLFFPFCRVHAV